MGEEPVPAPHPPPRDWDAGSYHDLAAPHQAWGAVILDRLPLRGDERVLDLGCGTGRVTAQLLERLGPDGRVVGIDGSARMVDEARRLLGDDPRVAFEQQDLLALGVSPPADAAVSSATFHWIKDHDTLFGLADLGFGCPELGTFSLSELARVHLPFGLGIERDLAFATPFGLSRWADTARRAGSILDAQAILQVAARDGDARPELPPDGE